MDFILAINTIIIIIILEFMRIICIISCNLILIMIYYVELKGNEVVEDVVVEFHFFDNNSDSENI